MTDVPAVNEAVALARGLEEWARRTGNSRAVLVVSDMTDIYCAARQYMKHIDSLIAQEPGPENARLLVGIQGWLYGELDDHLRGLKDPLNELIDDLYDHWPEE